MERRHRLVAVGMLLAGLGWPAAASASNVTITELDCGYVAASHVFLPTTTITRDASDTGETRVRALARLFDGATQLKQLSQGPVGSDGVAVPGTGDVGVGEETDFRPWSRAFGDGTPEGGDALEYDHTYSIRTDAFDFDTSETTSLTKTCKTPPAPKVKLTVLRTGAGTGNVQAAGGAIVCGSTCTHEYEKGTTVALTATAASGSAFAGWSGAGCAGTGKCTVTLDVPATVQTKFDVVQQGGGGPPPPDCIGRTLLGAAQEVGFNQYTLFETKPAGQPFFTLELTAQPGDMQVCREDGLTAPSPAALASNWSPATGRLLFPVVLAAGGVQNLVFDVSRLGWAVPAEIAGRALTTKFDPALTLEPPKPSSIDIFDPLGTGIDIASFTPSSSRRR
jgi:Divergent InlB B-repeat domain